MKRPRHEGTPNCWHLSTHVPLATWTRLLLVAAVGQGNSLEEPTQASRLIGREIGGKFQLREDVGAHRERIHDQPYAGWRQLRGCSDGRALSGGTVALPPCPSTASPRLSLTP